MHSKPKKVDEHMFSIELKSKENITRVALPNENGGNVLIEGFLGKLQDLNFTEGIMLEIQGTNGILRMDLSEKELKRLLSKGTPVHKKQQRRHKLDNHSR
jgi:hypothetical protein